MTHRSTPTGVVIGSVLVLCAGIALAQAPQRPPYGTDINLVMA